jgi:N-acetylglucosamine-6-phosphate deacetylase
MYMGGGCDVMDSTTQSLLNLAEIQLREGTPAFLPDNHVLPP